MNQDKRTYLIKRLLYKSNYRGCKETDLVLGNFAKKFIYDLSDEELMEFDKLLNKMDTDIWDWINNKKPLPDDISKDLMNKITQYFLT